MGPGSDLPASHVLQTSAGTSDLVAGYLLKGAGGLIG